MHLARCESAPITFAVPIRSHQSSSVPIRRRHSSSVLISPHQSQSVPSDHTSICFAQAAAACLGRFVRKLGKEFNADAAEPEREWHGLVTSLFGDLQDDKEPVLTTYYHEDRKMEDVYLSEVIKHLIPWSEMSECQLHRTCQHDVGRVNVEEELKGRCELQHKGARPGRISLAVKLLQALCVESGGVQHAHDALSQQQPRATQRAQASLMQYEYFVKQILLPIPTNVVTVLTYGIAFVN